MATQPERIASLETHRFWHWVALCVVAATGLGWLSWASLTLVSMKGDVQAIKQKIKDGGAWRHCKPASQSCVASATPGESLDGGCSDSDSSCQRK